MNIEFLIREAVATYPDVDPALLKQIVHYVVRTKQPGFIPEILYQDPALNKLIFDFTVEMLYPDEYPYDLDEYFGVRDFLGLAKIELYDWHIQLHKNRTELKLNHDPGPIVLGYCLAEAIDRFHEITGVEVVLLGRSRRHVCVDTTIDNIIRYDYLVGVALELEKEYIDCVNSYEAE